MPIVLASASPRRAELLQAAGMDFEVLAAHVDESARSGETPDAYVRRIAEDKVRVIAARAPDRIVLAADATVVIDGVMLGKPNDEDDAKRMLRMLSGRTHEVLTGVSIARAGALVLTEVEQTAVELAPLTEFGIDR